MFLYHYNSKEYIVDIIDGDIKEEEVKIKFLCRTEGGKGRMPSSKMVKSDKLLLLKEATLQTVL